MTDEEFDAIIESAWQEARNNPDQDTDDMDPAELALQVHSDLFEARYHELCTRGNVTEAEVKEVMAMKQALMAYAILRAQEGYETVIAVGRCANPERLSTDARAGLSKTLVQAFTSLTPLDDAAPLARQILTGLGLPTSIEEFEDYDGNNCRIKIDYQSCVLAPDNEYDQLVAVLHTSCLETE
jgi:hypothetical protein